MIEMIQARKTAEKKEERYDLFSSLLDANEEETDGNTKLSDSELMGACERRAWRGLGWTHAHV